VAAIDAGGDGLVVATVLGLGAPVAVSDDPNSLGAKFFVRLSSRENIAAVDDIGFDLGEGEVLGIVGESGSGKELAAAALYLCSPASDYVTGQVLAVDGGMTAL